MNWFFLFFFVSGFCGLVYEVVWLRLAMAQFGVTTPLTSIVLSVFMAGLALGSVLAGRLAPASSAARSDSGRALRAYALCELVVAASGILVPRFLSAGRAMLDRGGESASWGSSGYYLASSAVIVLALLPSCTCMGATFPLALAAIRGRHAAHAKRAFSFLYLANLLGAFGGTLFSAFVMIELLGFRATSSAAAALNLLLAATAFAVARRTPDAPAATATAAAAPAAAAPPFPRETRFLFAVLFTAGLVSLAMEVSWIRIFTAYLGTVVYAFASVLAIYLAASFVGSRVYRVWSARNPGTPLRRPLIAACGAAGLAGLLPLVTADPRIPLHGFPGAIARVVIGVAPFCAIAGFTTPMLLDTLAGGNPRRAGTAYAANVVGCIAGPLLAGFALLPIAGERWTLIALAVIPAALGAFGAAKRGEGAPARADDAAPWLVALLTGAFVVVLLTQSFESRFPGRVVRRDDTATVVAYGEGFARQLLVNGYGMTTLTPISKIMSHLPLAHLTGAPRDGLVVCFGMGTSFRSMRSWGIPVTAVELVPSVPRLFSFYHADGDELLRTPGSKIVVDDGRRFLERTASEFDVITVDPPPPVEAAGSSLLYSVEFYTAARRRLRDGGILQQWYPGGELTVGLSVAKAIREAFPYVRAFEGIDGWGTHFLASERPIPRLSADSLAQRLPPAASADLTEWYPGRSADEVFAALLGKELDLEEILANGAESAPLRDDRPVNEYFFLRRAFSPASH